MFSNTNFRTPFENRTNGLDRTMGKDKFVKGDKRPQPNNRWANKDLIKKTDGGECKFVYKDFMRSIKEIEPEGLYKVLEYLYDKIMMLPQNLHWQVFMELADLAKRENKIDDARKLLAISVQLQPYAHQAWLEYSKLEEECGRMGLARKYLMLGLHFSPTSDQLAIKFMKIEEKIGDVSTSRSILAGLNGLPVDKNWKILLEGALLEARSGNVDLARYILNYLVHNCDTFGAVYLEAIKFEEKWGNSLVMALELCEKGLQKNPRYGPLWFASVRVLEKCQINCEKSNSEFTIKQESLLIDAEQYLSKELLWKLYLDYGLFLEKNKKFSECKKFMKQAIINAPENLRWKAWIAASRVELKSGKAEKALTMLNYSLEEVPVKQKPLVLLEISQAHELLGDLAKAREFILEACEKSKHDWKIYLERINLEMRWGNFKQGLEISKEAVSKYYSTGRLWASLIQLLHTDKESISKDLQFKAFLVAIKEVPKSGEVWCEGARLRLNPFTKYYDLEKAEKYLQYAIQFTPQYGDSFIELLRVYLLQGKLHQISDLKQMCVNADPNYGLLWFFCKHNVLEGPKEVWKRAKSLVKNEICKMKKVYLVPQIHEEWIECMWTGITQANWSYSRNYTLDQSDRSKLIYGSEGLVI